MAFDLDDLDPKHKKPQPKNLDAMNIEQIAGPIGEALIMTAIGLFVAVPAVMGYNWLTRSNRVLTTKLDAFAFELLNFLLIGRTLQAQGRGGRPGNVPLTAVNY